jgi:integrase
MSKHRRPTGHLQVRPEARGNAYFATWRDAGGRRGARRLGPAHVRDSGRRTPRGAVIWRTSNGPRPTPEHLTPRDAQAQLEDILRELVTIDSLEAAATRCLRDAAEGWVAERSREKGLKRSTLQSYDDMFTRLYRDLGAETELSVFEDGRLKSYFDDFKAHRVLGKEAASRAREAGETVELITIERLTAQPPGSAAVEVGSKAEAIRLADDMPGTWKHRRRGAYRVVPLNAQRPRRVSLRTAEALHAEGWVIARREAKRWMLVKPAATQTRNEYRDVLAAAFDYAVRQCWITANPLAEVKRASKRRERAKILKRSDFYDRQEVAQLVEKAPGVFEEAFWLCGAHAGLRLPGEALGLRWGAVDFDAGVIRVYDNWVRNALDSTKTDDSEAIPMTPRLQSALERLKERGYTTDDDGFVFVHPRYHDKPAAERELRAAFVLARQQAGLKPIKMYNLRHSFGTSLAASRMDVRTIQALMRHDRLTTTEQYMAYAPKPELARQIAHALDW